MADVLEAASLRAVRGKYPKGANFLVAADVDEAFTRRHGSLTVTRRLPERAARGGPPVPEPAMIPSPRAAGSANLYGLMIGLVEKPLLRAVPRETAGNQVRAAQILGINRNTLRKKLIKHAIDPASPATEATSRDRPESYRFVKDGRGGGADVRRAREAHEAWRRRG